MGGFYPPQFKIVSPPNLISPTSPTGGDKLTKSYKQWLKWVGARGSPARTPPKKADCAPIPPKKLGTHGSAAPTPHVLLAAGSGVPRGGWGGGL